MDRSKLGVAMDSKNLKPRNIKETKVWQDTVGATQQLWSNYVNLLSVSFRNMPREEQCRLITRLSQYITIGVTALALSFFYQFLPLFFRVLALPAILVGSWLIGTRVVAPVIISRVERH